MATPRVSFNINGIGGQQTPTDSTNTIWFVPAEGYFEWDAIPQPGSTNSLMGFYADVRAGYEHVGSNFAKSIGLSNGNFGFTQVSFGLIIFNSFTLSAQRFYGPSQVVTNSTGTTVTVNNYGWSFQLQLSPTSAVQSNKGGS